jgi:diacylglycerol kinase family enzyme
MGLDGEIVRQVERRQALKKAAGHGFFLWTALRVGLIDYDLRTPRIEMRWGDDLEHEARGLVFAISQNLDPFTYLTRFPLHICPRAGLDLGLDCLGARPLSRFRTVRWAMKTLGSARHIRDRRAVYVHDQRRIDLRADRPLPVQMDGEFVGESRHLALESVPAALGIYA